MQGPTITTRACDACGATPAVYRETTGVEPYGELCEECARWRGAMRHGEACAGLEAIGFGIAVARRADMTDDQIRQAIELTLTAPEEDMSSPYNTSVLDERKENRPWMRTLRPLEIDGAVTA